MTLDFIYSKDLYEIREKVLKLDKEVRDTCKEEVTNVDEQKSGHLIKRVEEADKQIFSLTSKLRNLIDNYAAFSSVLESKKELSDQVSELKKKNTDITEKYNEEIEKLKCELQETKDNWAIILADANEEHRLKIGMLEDSWEKKLQREESQSLYLKEELDETIKSHDNSLEMLKKEHHEELANLRIQFEILQRSFPSSCGTDIYAQKFQQVKMELEKKLEEKDENVKELMRKLKEAEGEIRHLKLLSVVRNAQKAPPMSADVDSLSNNSKGTERNAVENGESNSVPISIVATVRNESKVQGNKGVKKRKLYSKVTFSSPEDILY